MSGVFDFAVSSYIPTVSTLLDKVKNHTKPRSNRFLLVSQASAPGLSYIPMTEKETSSVKTLMLPHASLDVLHLTSDMATTEAVKKEMDSYNSIHLACHGTQDIEHPLKSGFWLRDGCLDLSEIIKGHNTHADLAFLSACQTSKGDEKLSEEAVHLAAGMLAAGYRSVIATMWSIKDQYGPRMAEEFYKYILEEMKEKNEPFDCAKAAYALHYATQCLRRQLDGSEDSFLTWVPYIHLGL